MKSKNSRLDAIKLIISSKEIGSQDELLQELSKEGYVIDGTYSIKNAWKIALSFSPPQNDFYNYLPEAIDSQIKEWLK